MSLDVTQFDAFKSRYKDFLHRHGGEVVKAFEYGFQGFRQRFMAFDNPGMGIERQIASSFNVFTILGLGRREVQTHTPFLRELLDPHGTHGQGDLFLKSFLKEVLGMKAEEIGNPTDWVAMKENNYVDIKIINYKLPSAVFLENKIYSEAHSGQISRNYRLWRDYCDGIGKFVYLSIRGDLPADDGFEPTADKARIRDELEVKSYKTDINSWLLKAAPDVKAPVVQRTVEQYLDLIDLL